MRSALSKVTLQVSNNTSRKARSYIQAYAHMYGGSNVLIEEFAQVRKCHRNIFDQETAYLERVLATICEHDREVNQERLSLAREKNEREKYNWLTYKYITYKLYFDNLFSENCQTFLGGFSLSPKFSFMLTPWYTVCITSDQKHRKQISKNGATLTP